MENLIITVSREYESGGSAIGKYVAEKLEIPFYNREKIDLLAHEKGLDKLYIKNWQGQPPTSVIWDNADNPLAAFYDNVRICLGFRATLSVRLQLKVHA